MLTPHRSLGAVLIGTLLLLSTPPSYGESTQLSTQTSPVWVDTMMQRIGAKVMGESALIDRESGRIFWEGGSKTSISASISPLLVDIGVHRLKSSILSVVLMTCGLSLLAAHLRSRLEEHHPLSWPMAVLMVITRWTILQIPEFDTWFLVTIAVLYLLEAYYCNTRRYLANSISTPEEVEEYIERLRQESPQVTWKVRCFHYERRLWANILLPQLILRKLFRQENEESPPLNPSILTKKVVTSRAEATYVFKDCVDKTIAGVWKRATDSIGPPPFTKIMFAKLLILGNEKARKDYFQQQAAFVTMEGQADEYAEFSTNIAVPSFKPKLLAIRPVEGITTSTRLFRLHMFWLCTLCGFTVPFRIWFSRHCDQLRVTVAKETFADLPRSSSSSSSSWFGKSTPKNADNADDSLFRQVMQDLLLYNGDGSDSFGTPEALVDDDDGKTAELLQDIQEASEAARLVEQSVISGIDPASEETTAESSKVKDESNEC